MPVLLIGLELVQMARYGSTKVVRLQARGMSRSMFHE